MSLAVTQLAGFGAQPAFVPSDVANCELWLCADLRVTDAGGGAVSTWADLSGNGRDLTEATNRPSISAAAINGKNAISFDGSNDRLVSANFTVSAPFTVFIVSQNPGSTSLDCLWYTDNDNASTTPLRLARTSSTQVRLDGNGNTGATASINTSEWSLLTTFYNNTSSTLQKNLDTPGTSGGAIGTVAMDGFVLGARFSDRFHQLLIAEVVIYSGAITGNDLTKLQAYFSQRYAIF